MEFIMYEAPLIEFIEVEVEKGFAASDEKNYIKALSIEEW